MGEVAARYLTTKAAAAHFGVCPKTFRKMLAALPARKRPRQIEYPGTSLKKWRIEDLDSAFATASASSGWDALIDEADHFTTKRNRMGRSRGR